MAQNTQERKTHTRASRENARRYIMPVSHVSHILRCVFFFFLVAAISANVKFACCRFHTNTIAAFMHFAFSLSQNVSKPLCQSRDLSSKPRGRAPNTRLSDAQNGEYIYIYSTVYLNAPHLTLNIGTSLARDDLQLPEPGKKITSTATCLFEQEK